MDPARPATRRDLLAFGTSIFGEMTALALEHRAVNLSQGYPDFDGPGWVREAAVEAIRAGKNQYARSMGLPELARAVSTKVERQYGLKRDPGTEVSVFSGCTEAGVACIPPPPPSTPRNRRRADASPVSLFARRWRP